MISQMAYGLDLPPTWRIHPIFHVSNLKRFHRSEEFEREERPPSPIVVDGEEEYEMEAILRCEIWSLELRISLMSLLRMIINHENCILLSVNGWTTWSTRRMTLC